MLNPDFYIIHQNKIIYWLCNLWVSFSVSRTDPFEMVTTDSDPYCSIIYGSNSGGNGGGIDFCKLYILVIYFSNGKKKYIMTTRARSSSGLERESWAAVVVVAVAAASTTDEHIDYCESGKRKHKLSHIVSFFSFFFARFLPLLRQSCNNKTLAL